MGPGGTTEERSVLDQAWALDPLVSVRPERFGAMLYHFGTRRLSFIKDRRLLLVLEQLAGASTARAACKSARVGAGELPAFERALSRLVATEMLQEGDR